MRLVEVNLAARHEQELKAAKLMFEYEEYARSIGCKIGTGAMHDCIECTAEQSKLLEEKWKELTRTT